MPFQALEKLIHLREGYRRVFRVDGRELLLIVTEDQPHLLQRHCPHMGQALDQATINDGKLVCPRHGFSFDLRSGRCDQECKPLNRVPLRYHGNTIGIDT